MRKLPAIVVTAGVLMGLAACSPPVSTLAHCDVPFPSGGNSDVISVSGAHGAEPTVDFPTPLVAKSTQQTVIEPGEGDPIYPGQTIEFTATMLDGATGELLAATDYGPDGGLRARLNGAQLVPFLDCSRVGERLAVATDLQTVYQDAWSEQIGPADQTVVVVYDITAAYLGKANGWDQLPQAGFPSVVLAPDGRPGITVPGDAPPTDLRIATLKSGTGETVGEDDAFIVHYTAVNWDTEAVLDSSWTSQTGAPATFTADQVVDGFAKAVVGAKVGSQIIAVVPPEFGYDSGTTIFVIDILGIEE